MFAVALALIIDFAALARGAHDVWAATAVFLALLAVVTAVFVRQAWRPQAPGVTTDFALPMACVAAVMAASFGRSVNPSEAFLGLMDWLAAMAAFWIALNVLRTQRDLETFLAVVAPVFVVEALIHASQRPAPAFLFTQSWGTLVNANLAAAFTLPWIPVLFERARSARAPGGRQAVYWSAAFAAAGLCFIFAFSAWGWISLLSGLPLLLSVEDVRRRLKGWYVAAAAAVLASGAALVWWKLSHTHDWSGNPLRAGENLSRVLWWNSGIRMFLANPGLGVGVGNFASAYPAFKVGSGQNTLFAHSFPIGLAAETGLLGCAAVLYFFSFWLRRVIARWNELSERRPYVAGLAMLLIFSTISLSVEYLVNRLVCGVFLGIIAAPLVRSFYQPRRSAAFVLAAAALAACAFILAPLSASRLCAAASQRLSRGEVPAAVEAFSAAASLDPLSSTAQRGWARALAALPLRDLGQVVLRQTRAIELDRLNAVLWRELGDYLREAGRLDEARRAYETAASLRPGKAD